MSQPSSNFTRLHTSPIYRTTLLLTVRDAKTYRELFDTDIESIFIQDRSREFYIPAQVITPDLPRCKKYWKAVFEDVVPRIRLQVIGGPNYKDLTMSLSLDNKRRLTTVLVMLERRR